MLQLELVWWNYQIFCDCIFNIVTGNVELEKKYKQKSLSREKSIIEALWSKMKIPMKRKRHLASPAVYVY